MGYGIPMEFPKQNLDARLSTASNLLVLFCCMDPNYKPSP